MSLRSRAPCSCWRGSSVTKVDEGIAAYEGHEVHVSI